MSSSSSPSSAHVASMFTYAAVASAKTGEGLVSGIVAQLWSHLNVALAKSVKESVEPTFQKTLPFPLSTLHFTKLDLGSVPIRMDNIVVHEMSKGQTNGSPEQDTCDRVQFDMDIIWDGDCAIELKADYIGSFGVKQVKFNGRMSVILGPLTNELPVVAAALVAFVNPPRIELDFTGLANLADCAMIDSKIRQTIQSVLGDMMVLPNRMLFKLDPANSFLDTYKPPVGVARVTVLQGKGFASTKKAGLLQDVNDVYCHVQLGNTTWKTPTIHNCNEPKWEDDNNNNTVDFLLLDHDQVITIHAWDEDTGTPGIDSHDDLGSAQVTVGEILLAGKTMALDLHGETTSTMMGPSVWLRCEVCHLTLHSNLDSLLESNQNQNLLSGLLTILVTRAADIPLEQEQAACFVKVTYGEQYEFVTGTVVHAPGVDALNPVFDSVFHVPLKPEHVVSKAPIEFALVSGKDTVLGTTVVTHEDLVQAPNNTITETRPIGDAGASLEFRVSLRGVQPPQPSAISEENDPAPKDESPSVATATSSFVTSQNAIGTVRLTAAKGWGFESEKRRFRRKDVPDIYCNITFGSSPKVWKTLTIHNSTTPEWNESADYLLSDHGQMICVSVFDEDKKGDDEYLGGTRITVGKLLLAGGLMDVEMLKAGKPTGLFVSLRCDMVDH